MELDLRPYGIDGLLTPETNVDQFYKMNIRSASLDIRTNSIVMNGIHYHLINLLGSGSFGRTYEAEDPEGNIYAIKTIRPKKQFTSNTAYNNWLNSILSECIIQIVLADTSKTRENGPYVPFLYEIGILKDVNELILRVERMEDTFDDLIKSNTPSHNNIDIPNALIQICDILQFFQDSLQFNHRDFKPDNVMYMVKGDKNIYKLIDFGFSCLSWNGLTIASTSFFSKERPCAKSYRDLAQMIFYLCSYYGLGYNNTRLFGILVVHIQNVIKRTNSGNVANLGMLNAIYQKNNPQHSWFLTYDYLNRNNIYLPNVNPEKVKRSMIDFLMVANNSTLLHSTSQVAPYGFPAVGTYGALNIYHNSPVNNTREMNTATNTKKGGRKTMHKKRAKGKRTRKN